MCECYTFSTDFLCEKYLVVVGVVELLNPFLAQGLVVGSKAYRLILIAKTKVFEKFFKFQAIFYSINMVKYFVEISILYPSTLIYL